MTQQDKNWTRGERFAAIGLAIAITTAFSNKDIRCSVAHIDCNKPQPVIIIQSSDDPQSSSSDLTKKPLAKPSTQSADMDGDHSATKPIPGKINSGDQDLSNRDTYPKQFNQSRKEETGAESVIKKYYKALNSRNYDAAWNILPASTRENKRVHPNGQRDFIVFFELVREVQVSTMSIIESSKISAIIDTKLIYHMRNGKKVPVSLRYSVYRENTERDWLINKIDRQ
jgi:hypothetical protein